ncbi:MAG: acyl-CoA dehydrogenase family protein [Acidimicrobiales bacterium]
MEFALSDVQRRIRDELRSYFGALMTPELRQALRAEQEDEGGGDAYKQTVRRMGQDGWLGVGFPVEYGGRGWGPIEQYLFFEEAQLAEAPIPLLALNTVGPAIMEFGSPAQKQAVIPAILRGEFHACIGYSEPDAGTDLAALSTRAERDGDEWVVNGQKQWTTQANFADYVWLACRTDPQAPRHQGISIFLVPMDTPGIKVVPIQTLVGRTNATYYDDVRVPHSALVGEVNGGWKLITTQLNFERSTIVSSAPGTHTLARVEEWARRTRLADGTRVIDEPWVQANLAKVRVKLHALRILNWRVAWSIEHKTFDYAAASAVKVFGTELYVEAYHLLMEVTGPPGYLVEGPGSELLDGLVERMTRRAVLTTFGGGVNEIQRDIIAMAGLGMPRSPR